MKKSGMKKTVWLCRLALFGILLNGCSDQPRQQHSLAADLADSKIIALQAAVDQANEARQAIIKAGDNQRLALQNANKKQAAVQQAIAQAAKQSQQLQQDAENKSRWAQKIHHKAIVSRAALLQAAMQQADAKQQLLKAEKAVQLARHQFELDQQDAQLAASIQQEANKALNLVQEVKQLAALSMHQFTANQNIDNQTPTIHTSAKQKKPGIINFIAHTTITAHATTKTINKTTQRHAAKKQPRRVTTASNTKQSTHKATSKTKKSPTAHRPLKLASLVSQQPDSLQRGHALTQKCLLCHNLKAGQKKKFGPNLFAVVDQQAGKSKHYKYSSTLATADFIWNDDNLAQWICHSGKSIKQLTGRSNARTKMPNQRICGQDAKDVVAYLRTIQTPTSIASNRARTGRGLQLAGAI